MKICGCEDAEKGYVIINPDSPDRQQILSLKPPICHEIKSNVLKYVVNGEEITFVGTKEINSSNPYTLSNISGAVRVDWGGGDIVFLSGTTWNIETLSREIVGSAMYEYYCEAREIITAPPAIAGTYRWFNIGALPNRTPPTFYNYNQADNQAFFLLYQSNAYRNPTPELTSDGQNIYYARLYNGIDGRIESFTAPAVWSYAFDPAFRVHYEARITGHRLVWGTPAFENYGYKVTTNTGATSARQTSTAPTITVTSSAYQVVVNYLDGAQSPPIDYATQPTNFQLINNLEISDTTGILQNIYPYQNQNIVIQCGDRQCPPEACFNCDCGALNCCYDENGRLIDSFIRRT